MVVRMAALSSLLLASAAALPHCRPRPISALRARVQLGGAGRLPPSGGGGRGRGGGAGGEGGDDNEGPVPGWLTSHPIVLKSVSMGVTYSLADVAAQYWDRSKGGDQMSLWERARRNLALALVGLLWVGPLLTVWFDYLAVLVPGASVGPAILRTLIDQLLEAPFMISSIFFFSALAEGHDVQFALHKVKTKVLPTWKGCTGVWLPVQLVNQGLVPLHLRVYFQSFVSFFWDAYMSVAAHG